MPDYKIKSNNFHAEQFAGKDIKHNSHDVVVDQKTARVEMKFRKKELQTDGSYAFFDKCALCGKPSKDHGYIMKSNRGGRAVCPDSWIVETGNGDYDVYSDDDFKAKYEEVV